MLWLFCFIMIQLMSKQTHLKVYYVHFVLVGWILEFIDPANSGRES